LVATREVHERALALSRQVLRAMKAHNAFEAAAAVAFWFFLSLVPLLVLIGFLAGLLARTRGVDALLGPVLDVVPKAAESLLRHELERMAEAGTAPLAPVGIAGYLWTASSGLHNLMDVFTTAARVKPRAWWKQRGIALGWVVLGLATMCFLAWLFSKVDAVFDDRVHRLGQRILGAPRNRIYRGNHRPSEQIFAGAIMLLLGLAFLAGFYRLATPRPRRVRRRVWPGAMAAIASWLLVSWMFGAYVVSISDYAVYYGSLAAVAVLLVWLYLTGLSLVLGAELNAQLESRPARR
jgi:membrane protein